MHFAEALKEDRRLVMLTLLLQSPAATCNAYVLHQHLPNYGHANSLDAVKTDLAWLAEQGLLHLVNEAPVLVATLTERGADVANGRATAPGVKRRLPGS